MEQEQPKIIDANSIITQDNKLYHEFVECISSALDARDPYTGDHSRRVSDTATVLAKMLGLADDEIQEIHIAAHLHDIGKIGIPDSILLKPGRLDDEEWALMKQHPQIGSDILSKSPSFSRISAIILHHHERYDGKGYPFGAKADEIPIGARIIAVCDSIDAMASARAYRKALPLDIVRNEIEKNIGLMYDPAVAKKMLDNWSIITLQQIVDESRSIVFFGGAGVSTESGIPDFRSADGLYNQKYDVPPEELLSHEYFFEHTEKFFEFYREKMLCLDAKPNKAHLKLAELERAGKLTAVITQNIDGLHTAAGSKTVYELHGSVHRNYCLKCGKSYSAEDILRSEGVPRCECGGIIKPDVVLYGENLDDRTVTGALAAIESCDTLIIGGTSLTVYPAAGFIRYFGGRNLVLINMSATPYDSRADLAIHDKVGEVLDKIKVN